MNCSQFSQRYENTIQSFFEHCKVFVFLILFYYTTIDEQTKRRELQFVLTKSDLVSSKLLTTMQVEIPLPLNL